MLGYHYHDDNNGNAIKCMDEQCEITKKRIEKYSELVQKEEEILEKYEKTVELRETICKRRKSVAVTTPQRNSAVGNLNHSPSHLHHYHSDLTEMDQRFTDVITHAHGSPKSRRNSVPSKLLSQQNHHHSDTHDKTKKNGISQYHQLSNVKELSSTEDLRRHSYLLQRKLQDVTHSLSMPSSPAMSRNSRRRSQMSPRSSPLATRKTNMANTTDTSPENSIMDSSACPQSQRVLGNDIPRASSLVTKKINKNSESRPRHIQIGEVAQRKSIEARTPSPLASPLATTIQKTMDSVSAKQMHFRDNSPSRDQTKASQSATLMDAKNQSKQELVQHRSKTTSAEILCDTVKRRMRKISASAENLNEIKGQRDKRINQLKESKNTPNSTSLDNIHFVSLTPHPKSIAQLNHSNQTSARRLHRSLENLISTPDSRSISKEIDLEANQLSTLSARLQGRVAHDVAHKTLETSVGIDNLVNEVQKRRRAAQQKLKKRQHLLNDLNRDIKIANRVLRNLKTRSVPLLDQMDINFEIPYEFIQAILDSNDHHELDRTHGTVDALIV